MKITLNSDQAMLEILAKLNQLNHQEGWVVTIEQAKQSKQRTMTQNAALHKYLEMLAELLNEAGLDMKKVLKPQVDIPWTKESAKEHLWKPIQQIVIDKSSTTQATTAEYSQVYDVLSRHLAEKFGIYCPWPSREVLNAK